MSSTDQQILSISIVTYLPDLDLLTLQANSLLAAIARIPAACSVVLYYSLNGSESATSVRAAVPWDALDQTCVDLNIVKNAKNLGYGAGHNGVIATVDSDFHLVLNPDVLLDADSLKFAIGYLQDNKDAVALSPLATELSGARQYLAKRYPTLFDFTLRGFAPAWLQQRFAQRLAHYEYRGETEQQVVPDVEIISGCFMFCRTESLHQLGGFDESWFLYFEDFDLSMRLHDLGAIAYVPAVKISHEGGNAANKGFAHLKMFIFSALRFFHRWGWKLW